MVSLKNFLPKVYSLFLIVFALSTFGCYSRPKKSGLLDYMNISNIVSYLGGTASEINVQVNGLTNSGILIVELVSTGEQITFNAGAGTLTDTFSGVYDYNQTYTLNIFAQPATSPTQTCIISNPNLNLNFYNKTFVVNCAENWYKANVSITGIDSTNTTNLEIYNNGTDLKTRTSNGTVSFDVGDGLGYDITIGAVPTVPSTHTCQVVTSPANGTISGADVNLQISCLSLMKTSVASGSFMPSTKAMTFTFSGPVTGCILDSTGGGPPYNAGTASGSPGITYAGNGAKIAPTTLPWSFGALTFPLQVSFTLTGCADAVAAANNGATLSVTVKMMDGDVYFVSDTSGNDSNSCLDPSVSCKTIQTAVSQCSSSSICTVFVEGGNYIISGSVSPITLNSSGGVRLLGSFDPTFSTQSLDLTPSRIADNRTVAQCPGTILSSNECAPITVTASGMGGDSTKAHVIQGFSIFADETKQNSFGIRIKNGDSNSFSYIFGNYISGGEGGLGVENSAGTRGGIYLLSSPSNNQIDTNVIKGGFGASNSTAVYSTDSNLYLLRNRISGDKAVNDSHSVWLVNFVDSLVAIINNTMNFRPYSDGSVTSKFTYGIRNEENTALIKFYIAGNTIYSGGATVGSNYGIFMTGVATNAQMANNLIVGQGTSAVCSSFSTTPSTNAVFRGNSLDCPSGKTVTVGATNFAIFCSGNGTFNISGLCLVANAFMNDVLTATRSNQNFVTTPSFNGYPIAQPWLSMNTATGGPCSIAFGGVETSSYLNSFDPNYKLDAVIGAPVTRTSSSGGTTPFGSDGYSIGAFERDDPGCF
ncbi:hypothetical protein [Leptospira licerasiae]|uniref:Right-handed parallel beta-helix repeat-containing protein n=1 Tax=Leptospira licerasiae str. MMD4847 TaxID=1049971 RepID=A0ABN0HB88_9LEPT|nr:hypothetical protein [Leptospira licerasiae]EIE00456.1 hypothetical protein LEP1GSC185_3257 [Leptospira licerasiae serovar Varillal str. VAR 010]EJZ42857.1 hypothetical protein LEP1GSC178_2874 [Leptospira licerasiae str. MMD4847]